MISPKNVARNVIDHTAKGSLFILCDNDRIMQAFEIGDQYLLLDYILTLNCLVGKYGSGLGGYILQLPKK